jgi:uncharacterized membrane protein YkgB
MTVKDHIGYHPIPAARPPTAVGSVHYATLIALLRRHSMAALRIALGAVYLWFGALKLTSSPPVAQLIHDSVPFVSAPAWLVPAMGGFELVIGLCFVLRLAPLVLLPLFVAHLVGTFSVLVIQPGVAFEHGNPLMLSIIGEFVVKNLVLLAAGIVVCTRTRADDPSSTHPAELLVGRAVPAGRGSSPA